MIYGLIITFLSTISAICIETNKDIINAPSIVTLHQAETTTGQLGDTLYNLSDEKEYDMFFHSCSLDADTIEKVMLKFDFKFSPLFLKNLIDHDGEQQLKSYIFGKKDNFQILSDVPSMNSCPYVLALFLLKTIDQSCIHRHYHWQMSMTVSEGCSIGFLISKKPTKTLVKLFKQASGAWERRKTPHAIVTN